MKTTMTHFGSHGMENADFGMLVPENKNKVFYYAVGTSALIIAYLIITSRNYGK